MSPSHDREEPPEWGNDPLSFFRDAEYNARVTAVKLPAVYELLQRVHTLFRKFKDLIAKDPKGTQRALIWLRRNEDAIAKSRCKSEFTVTKLRQTHEALDPDTAADLHKIYEDLIDFGVHPNQFGVMMAMRKSGDDAQTDFSVGILHAEPLPMVLALRMAVGVALGALKTFQLVFPERFMLTGIDMEVQNLIAEANSVLKSYPPKDQSGGRTG